MKKPIQKIVLIVIGLLFIMAVYAFYGDRPSAPADTRVRVMRGDVIVRVMETGFLEPVDAIEIKSEQAGEVKTIFVQAGDTVVQGQKLLALRLESNQAQRVAEARALIEQERLNLEEARREHQRMRELFGKGFIARREMEVEAKRAENAKIKYELAKKQLLLALGGNKALYEKYLKVDPFSETQAEFTVVAPISGTVIEMNVSGGQMVSSGLSTFTNGTTLMRIANLSKMWIKTRVNEVDIGRIQVGQSATIHLDAVGSHSYRGKVVKISPKGETVENVVSYEVTLEIENPDQRLKPSMTAKVDIITHVARDALYLPQMALVVWKGQDAVRVPSGGEGETAFKIVATGVKNETLVVIQSGLLEGEEVVLPKAEKSES